MSEDKEQHEELPVTESRLTEVLEGMSRVFTENNEKMLQAVDEMTSKKLNNQASETSKAIADLQNSVNSLVTWANTIQQQPQGQARAKGDGISELLNSPAGQELIPIIKEKLGLSSGQPDPAVEEFRRNTEQLNRIVYKKAALMTAKMIEKGMKGMMSSEFTTTAASNMATSAITHEPI